MKVTIPQKNIKWLLEPGCVVLVTSGTIHRSNIITISWQTPINSNNPCLILLVINPRRYSYELIKINMQLVINVPGENLLNEVHFIGTVTGREIDKFKKSNLTPMPAKKVKPPLIKECVAHLECNVSNIVNSKNHDLLICEVINAEAENEYFNGKWIPEKFHTIHYLGGKYYGSLGKTLSTCDLKLNQLYNNEYKL